MTQLLDLVCFGEKSKRPTTIFSFFFDFIEENCKKRQ
jgi:hypothetical protein